ncbi:conserved hypothetical protein [Ricinus communis]|uniref:Uncharacterized protein n=1 Tax=Ricinus communis TaxID=3988 RepID=B9TEC9_RICCO|nr:conserved hypothetical protein [Ricinus communis]
MTAGHVAIGIRDRHVQMHALGADRAGQGQQFAVAVDHGRAVAAGQPEHGRRQAAHGRQHEGGAQVPPLRPRFETAAQVVSRVQSFDMHGHHAEDTPSERPHADERAMQPECERRPAGHAGEQHLQITRHAGRRRRAPIIRFTPAQQHEVDQRPDQETAEQQQVGQRAIGQQVGAAPQRDRCGQRLTQPGGDVRAGQQGGGEQYEGRQHQRRGGVARPRRRQPQPDRIGPGLAVAPHQQRESRQRSQRVQRPPRARAVARDHLPAQAGRDQPQRMHADHQPQSCHQCRHPSSPPTGSSSRTSC